MKKIMKAFVMLVVLALSMGSFAAYAEEASQSQAPVVVEPTEAPKSTEAPAVESDKPTPEPAVTATATPAPEQSPAATPQPTQTPAPEIIATLVPEITQTPTTEPVATPTAEPTQAPNVEPTVVPTEEPTEVPSSEPTVEPSVEPTAIPFTAEVKIELVNTGDIFFGDEVTLRAVVRNASAAYTIRWECSEDGQTWKEIENETTDEYKFIVTEENVELSYRIVLTAQV